MQPGDAEKFYHGIGISSGERSSGTEAEKAIHPSHIQASLTYEAYLTAVGGREFIVTGENGDFKQPVPVVVKVQESGLSMKAI